jgi:hypothetical protein
MIVGDRPRDLLSGATRPDLVSHTEVGETQTSWCSFAEEAPREATPL